MLLNHRGEPIKRPLLNREIATSRDGRDITADWIGEIRYPQDRILRYKGYDYRIYEKLLEDPQVASTFEQRRLALTSRETEVTPGGKRKIDRMAADFIREQIDHLRWANLVDKKLFCRLYGFSVAELLFANDGRHVFADNIKTKKPRRFTFDQQGRLRLRTRSNWQGEPVEEMYPNKFWVTTVGGDNDDDPFGSGFGSALYWPTFFKRNDIKFWLTFLEKFGQPTAVGKYDRNATDPERAKLLEALAAIQTDAGIIIPEGMMVELLEAARNGTADYDALATRMDLAISKVTVGQTLTTDAGASLSQSKVHLSVRQDLVQADSRLIDESFIDRVVSPLCALNYPGAACPKVSHRVAETNLKAQAEKDKILFDMGYRRTPESMQAEYGEGYEAVEPQPATPRGIGINFSEDGAAFIHPSSIRDLVDLAKAVAAGSLSPSAAEGILRLAFPDMSPGDAAAILGGEVNAPPKIGFQLPDFANFAEQEESTAEVYRRRLQRQLGPQIQGWLDRVRAELRDSKSLSEFVERLDRLYPDLDSEQFAEVMQQALVATRAAGWYEVQEGE